jgi:hypothetical protein
MKSETQTNNNTEREKMKTAMKAAQLEFLKRAHLQLLSAAQNIRDAHIDCTPVESLMLLPTIGDAHAVAKRLIAIISALEIE